MSDYLRSLEELKSSESEILVSKEIAKVESEKIRLEDELEEEMERDRAELAEYYIALERGEPEEVIWGTYDDYLRAARGIQEPIEDEIDDDYDPEEDPDDPLFQGVDLDGITEPLMELAPLFEIELDNGLESKLEEGEIDPREYEEKSEEEEEGSAEYDQCYRLDSDYYGNERENDSDSSGYDTLEPDGTVLRRAEPKLHYPVRSITMDFELERSTAHDRNPIPIHVLLLHVLS